MEPRSQLRVGDRFIKIRGDAAKNGESAATPQESPQLGNGDGAAKSDGQAGEKGMDVDGGT